MYEEALRTPLMMKYPKKISVGSISKHLVQNLDIAPTLLKVAGVEIPNDMQGIPLQQTWTEQGTKWRDAIYYHYYEKGFGATPHYGVRTERYKLIHFYDVVDSWELYDLEKDPTEMNNLYGKVQYKQIQEELHSRLNELQLQYKDSSLPQN